VWALSIIAATGEYWARRGNWERASAALLVGCAGVQAGAAIGSPFYFLDWSRFHQVMTMRAATTVAGQAPCTYRWQLLDMMLFIFQARQLLLWSIGLSLATLGPAGAAHMSETCDMPSETYRMAPSPRTSDCLFHCDLPVVFQVHPLSIADSSLHEPRHHTWHTRLRDRAAWSLERLSAH